RISIRHTPAIAIGTLPTASQRAIPRCTVWCLRWRPAPAGFVIGAEHMSVPTAVTGWTPKARIKRGVISDPPPMPVMPISMPMPKPNTTMMGSMPGGGGVRLRPTGPTGNEDISAFVDRLSEERPRMVAGSRGLADFPRIRVVDEALDLTG